MDCHEIFYSYQVSHKTNLSLLETEYYSDQHPIGVTHRSTTLDCWIFHSDSLIIHWEIKDSVKNTILKKVKSNSWICLLIRIKSLMGSLLTHRTSKFGGNPLGSFWCNPAYNPTTKRTRTKTKPSLVEVVRLWCDGIAQMSNSAKKPWTVRWSF